MGAAQNQGTATELDLHHRQLRNCSTFTRGEETFLQATLPAQIPIVAKWKEQLQDIQKSSLDKTFLLFPLQHHFQDGGVCSTTGELTLQFDYYPHLLSTEIVTRRKDNRKFNQAQLWYLLFALVMAKSELNQNKHNLGDLHPGNIFLNTKQQVKVACLYSWPGQVSSYRRAILQEQPGYLSPEDVDRLKLGAMDNRTNSQSQIFAIGLTLLSASNLHLNQDLYRVKERDFDLQVFHQRIHKFQQDPAYSQIYRAIVTNLLEQEPIKRLNLEQLKQLLFKHKDNIINKKPLLIDNVPKKLQQTINVLIKWLGTHQQSIPINQQFQGHQPIPRNNSQQRSLKGSTTGSKTNPQKLMSFITFQGNKQLQHPPNPPVNTDPRQLPPTMPKGPLPYVPLQNNIPRSPSGTAPNYFPPVFQQEPIRPNIQRAFSPNQGLGQRGLQRNNSQNEGKFKPFQTINSKTDLPSPKQQAASDKKQSVANVFVQPSKEAPIIEESKVTQVMNNRTPDVWEIDEKSMVGQLNLLMETKKDGFDFGNKKSREKQQEKQEQAVLKCESLIESHKRETLFKKEEQIQKIIIQKEVIPEEQHHQQIAQEQKFQKQASFKKEEQQNQISQPQAQIKRQQFHEQPQLSCKDSLDPQNSIVKKLINIKEEITHSQQPHTDIHSQTIAEHQTSTKAVVQNLKKQHKIQTIEYQTITNYQQFATNKFSPLVKVWGVQKGQLKTKDVSTSQHVTSYVNHIAIPQAIDNSKIATPKFQAASRAEEIPVVQPNNYILIDEGKSVASEKSPQVQSLNQKQVNQQSKSNNTSKSDQKPGQQQNDLQISVDRQIQKQSSLFVPDPNDNSKWSQIHNYHTYVDIATEGTFDQCWQELLKMIQQPYQYCSAIDINKVLLMRGEKITIKVGPAIVIFSQNKEEGKIMLAKAEQSKCEGQILGGVFKDQDKKHRIWFNSALLYKNNPFPNRQLFQQALTTANKNITQLHRPA